MFYFQKPSSGKTDSVSPGIESQTFLIKIHVHYFNQLTNDLKNFKA